MSDRNRSDVALAGRRLKSRIYVALLFSSVLPLLVLAYVTHVYILPAMNPMDSENGMVLAKLCANAM